MKIITKYMEFEYGIHKNVYKTYTKRIISVYKFLIGYKYQYLFNKTAVNIEIKINYTKLNF